MADKKPRKPRVSPTLEHCEEICAKLAEGQTLKEIFRDETLPDNSRFFRWLLKAENEVARNMYQAARESSGLVHGDRVVELANKVEQGLIDPNAARVAIDALKWVAGNRASKFYGRKNQEEGAVTGGIKIEITQSEKGLC